MKNDETNFWQFALMVIPSGALVCAGFAWLLFETSLGNGMPDAEKILVPICIFIAGSWMLLRKRPKRFREILKS